MRMPFGCAVAIGLMALVLACSPGAEAFTLQSPEPASLHPEPSPDLSACLSAMAWIIIKHDHPLDYTPRISEEMSIGQARMHGFLYPAEDQPFDLLDEYCRMFLDESVMDQLSTRLKSR